VYALWDIVDMNHAGHSVIALHDIIMCHSFIYVYETENVSGVVSG